MQTIYTKKGSSTRHTGNIQEKWSIVSSCPLSLKKDVKSLKSLWDKAVLNGGESEKDITKQNEITCLPPVCYEAKNIELENINCKFCYLKTQ